MKTIHELLQECDALKARLSALRPLPVEALKKIEGAFAIEYTYESNRIEGNTLTLQETELVVNEGVTIAGKSMREHLEAINHAEAIDYIKDFARSSTEISERTPLVLVGQPVGRQFDLIPAYDKCLRVEGISLTDTQRIFDRLL